MKFCWLAAALTLLPALAQLDAERAKGRIFEDRNGNASWEADEPGIPNVRVSKRYRCRAERCERGLLDRRGGSSGPLHH